MFDTDNSDQNVKHVLNDTFGWLSDNEFILSSGDESSGFIQPTKLGEASVAAGMEPKIALGLFDDLSAAARSLNLETDLHLIYLCTPFENDMPKAAWTLLPDMVLALEPELSHVAQMCYVDENLLRRIRRVGKPGGSADPNGARKLQIIIRFYRALALYRLTREEPLDEVAARFGFPRGQLQSLQCRVLNTKTPHHLNWPIRKHVQSTHSSIAIDQFKLC